MESLRPPAPDAAPEDVVDVPALNALPMLDEPEVPEAQREEALASETGSPEDFTPRIPSPALDDTDPSSFENAGSLPESVPSVDESESPDGVWFDEEPSGDRAATLDAAELAACEGSRSEPDAAGPTTLEPQVLPGDEPVDPTESGDDAPLVIAAFVEPPRRILAGLLLVLVVLFVFVGSRWLSRHRAEAANHSPKAPPSTAVAPVVQAPPATLTAEPLLETLVEGDVTNQSSSSGSRHAPPDVSEESPRQYGPSVARFPDLPRSVLIELERAAAPADSTDDAR
jgi:hypothetical protein